MGVVRKRFENAKIVVKNHNIVLIMIQGMIDIINKINKSNRTYI